MTIESLSAKDLSAKLKYLGFNQYSKVFLTNEITGADIPYLTEDHLIEMHINLIGHRMLLLKKLNELIDGKNPSPVDLINTNKEIEFKNTADVEEDNDEYSGFDSRRVDSSRRQNDLMKENIRANSSTKRQRDFEDESDDASSASSSQQTKLGSKTATPKTNKEVKTGSVQPQPVLRTATPKSTTNKVVAPPSTASTPAPKQEDDNKIECEFCNRRFPPDAAKRHIPVCGRIRGKK